MMYPANLHQLRKVEFQQLKTCVYLDHAGSTLYSNSQIANYTHDLQSNLYGNPHSISPSSDLTSDVVHQMRCTVLAHFNTSLEEYDLIFTSGATDALKLLASAYDWSSETSKFAYLEDNHTSVVGIRGAAAQCHASTVCLCLTKGKDDWSPFSLSSYHPKMIKNDTTSPSLKTSSRCCNLFAYSAQSNFSGCQYPLEWIEQVKDHGIPCITAKNSCEEDKVEEIWTVLLDAASFAATSPLDLCKYSPDFVCLSFYKLFGFPTGLGALLVRQSSAKYLSSKTYFGGGTADGYLAREEYFKPRQVLHDRLEDGTLAFLDILALKHGFDFLNKSIGKSMERVKNYTFSLVQKLYAELSGLKHANGRSAIEIYTNSNFKDRLKQGPILAFNVKRSDNSYIGFNHVLHLASSRNIHLRGGCFCNVGACMSSVDISADALKSAYESGHSCGGSLDLLNGQPLGAIRASLGYMSVEEDVLALVDFLRDCFVNENENELFYDASSYSPSQLRLKGIFVYPIKSCRAMKVGKWPLCETGLKYDRSWMILNEYGVCLTLKREHKMAKIQPSINLKEETLTLTAKGFASLTIPINVKATDEMVMMKPCQTKVCGDRIMGIDCGEEVAQWLSSVIEKPVRLVFKHPDTRRIKATNNDVNSSKFPPLALTNEAQYLLLSLESVEYLHRAIMESNKDENMLGENVDSIMDRFRCNFLVTGSEPFAEETWSEIVVEKSGSDVKAIRFQCSGLCNRCGMICVDNRTGAKSFEPLRTLGTLPLTRETTTSGRRTTFGVYLRSDSSDAVICSGDIVTVS